MEVACEAQLPRYGVVGSLSEVGMRVLNFPEPDFWPGITSGLPVILAKP